jgi:hypothetical protein
MSKGRVIAAVHESVFGRYCCKSLFALLIKNSPGCRRDFRVKMWGTSSPDDKLTGDLGNVIEATQSGGRRLVRVMAGKSITGQFWTFTTVSARFGPADHRWKCPFIGVKRSCGPRVRNDAIDPACVKTHTSAKCRKYNSPTRYRTSCAQHDSTPWCAISSRCFYVRGGRWSFRTAKTQLRHGRLKTFAPQKHCSFFR